MTVLLSPHRSSLVSETKGLTGNVTTSNSAASQSFYFWSPIDLVFTQVLWDLSQAGTYELRVGGTLIKTTVVASAGDGVDMMSGVAPFVVPCVGDSLIEIKLTKTAGSGGWKYLANNNGYVNDWFHSADWIELSPNEGVPCRITATRASRYLLHAPIATSSSSGYSSVAFSITWATDVYAKGITAAAPGRALYRTSIDGSVVGTSPTAVGGASLTASGPSAWVPFASAFKFTAGVAYAIEIVRTTAGGISCGYKSGPTHSDSLIALQTAWTEPSGSVIACIGWDLISW